MIIEITKPAKKQLSKLERQIAQRILKSLKDFLENPSTENIKKLTNTPDLWRMRIGDYRIIIEFDHAKTFGKVLSIRHRREVYKKR